MIYSILINRLMGEVDKSDKTWFFAVPAVFAVVNLKYL